MIPCNALEDAPQIDSRFEVAAFIELGRPKPGPVGDDPLARYGAAHQKRDGGRAVVSLQSCH